MQYKNEIPKHQTECRVECVFNKQRGKYMQGKKKKNSWLTHRNQISCWFLNLKFISQKKNTPSTYQNKNLFPLRKNKQKKNKCTHTQQTYSDISNITALNAT